MSSSSVTVASTQPTQSVQQAQPAQPDQPVVVIPELDNEEEHDEKKIDSGLDNLSKYNPRTQAFKVVWKIWNSGAYHKSHKPIPAKPVDSSNPPVRADVLSAQSPPIPIYHDET